MNEPIEKRQCQTTNKEQSFCPNSNTNDEHEDNYVYVIDVLQRQHKEHVEHVERQVQLLQHHLLRIP